MPINPVRNHIRVRRSDGANYSSMAIAYRTLLGTVHELTLGEHSRIRSSVRAGGSVVDRHGFTWSSVGGTVSETAIVWRDFTFGVEIECLCPRSIPETRARLISENFRDWKIVPDGSVHNADNFFGMEIVSPILTGEAGLAKLRELLDFLRLQIGARVNSECGLHVHIGVRGMKPTRLRKIAISFLNNERNFDMLVPPSRWENRHCQSNVRTFHRFRRSRLANAETIDQLGVCLNGGNSTSMYNDYRRHKLNFQSYVRHGTLEFRQHGGSVEANKVCAWVRLIAGFCAGAASAPEQALDHSNSFESFLDTALPEPDADDAKTYLHGRRAKFAAENI